MDMANLNFVNKTLNNKTITKVGLHICQYISTHVSFSTICLEPWFKENRTLDLKADMNSQMSEPTFSKQISMYFTVLVHIIQYALCSQLLIFPVGLINIQ